MEEIASFLKNNRDKYLWLFFIIIQQILIIAYSKIFILSNNNIVVDDVVLIFDLVSIIYIYIAGHMRKDNDIFLRKIIIFVSLIVWQHLFVLNSNTFWYDLGILLQPIVTYIFTVGSFNLLLYEKTDFKRKIDFVINIVLIFMIPIFLINRTLFNLMYLILFVGLHLYPALIILHFRDYFNSILSKIRRECLIFSVFLLGVLCFNFIESVIGTENIYSNIGWYIVTTTICIITYLRLIQEVLLVRMKSILGKITVISFVVVLSLIVLWIFLLYENIKRFDYIILVVGITELFVFTIALYVRMYLEYRKYITSESFENSKFISMLKIEEQIKEKFAEYLHDDILQSIIALKNITQVSLTSGENKDIIVGELNNLVNSIRNEVDTQKPIVYGGDNLKRIYKELINELLDKYQTKKKVDFYCMDNVVIYSPYSFIVYRMLKELINNGIKYSSGYVIEVYLDVKFDNIHLRTLNLTENDEIKIGNGLDSICKKVNFLKGNIDYYIEKRNFHIDIVIPMERRACFEDIID